MKKFILIASISLISASEQKIQLPSEKKLRKTFCDSDAAKALVKTLARQQMTRTEIQQEVLVALETQFKHLLPKKRTKDNKKDVCEKGIEFAAQRMTDIIIKNHK